MDEQERITKEDIIEMLRWEQGRHSTKTPFGKYRYDIYEVVIKIIENTNGEIIKSTKC